MEQRLANVRDTTVVQAAVRMDEPELIRAAQQGDQRAFEQLVRLYDQNVLRLATNLLAVARRRQRYLSGSVPAGV